MSCGSGERALSDVANLNTIRLFDTLVSDCPYVSIGLEDEVVFDDTTSETRGTLFRNGATVTVLWALDVDRVDGVKTVEKSFSLRKGVVLL